jgi:hypothetical protein
MNEPNKAYVAASFAAKADAAAAAKRVEDIGFVCTSRWIVESPEVGVIEGNDEERKRYFCDMDVSDVLAANILIVLTNVPSTSGGWHTEVGIAIGRMMPIILVGQRRNVFHYHPLVTVVDTVDEAIAALKEIKI